MAERYAMCDDCTPSQRIVYSKKLKKWLHIRPQGKFRLHDAKPKEKEK